jgi:site-specific DNA recombinase
MTQRAAIYARVSTDIQRENYSIPTQISDLLKHAKLEGYVVVGDQYVDPVAGKDTVKSPTAVPAFVDDYTSTELSRPGLNAALIFAESTGFDVLIVHAIDRLARDPYFRQTIEREFMARGARVEYFLGNYDETPEGEVKKDLDATFAKWENAKRVERCNRGRKRKAEMGKFVNGTVPFGYRMDRNAYGGLSVIEEDSETVRTIYYWFVEERRSVDQIVHKLNKSGAKTYHESNVWAKSTVHHILTNTTYAGYFFYNKNKRHGRKIVQKDKSEWIRIECTPIVSMDAFLAAQEIKKHNREYARQMPKRFYLLTGMVLCADCKKAYVTQTKKAGKNRLKNDAPSYRHRINHGHCSNRQISGRILEPLVWDKVVSILLNPMLLREGYEQSMEQERQKQVRQIHHLEHLQTVIEKLKVKREKLQAIYLDPDVGMTKAEYIELKTPIDEQIKAAGLEAENASQELQRIPSPEDLKSLEQFASKIIGALGNDLDISPQDKRQIMQMLNLKVLISKNGALKLEGWFAPEADGLLSTSSVYYVHRLRQLPVHA